MSDHLDDELDLDLEPFDAEFIANREAEFMALLLNPDPDPEADLLDLHPFGGDR